MKKSIELILVEREELRLGEDIYITLLDARTGRCKIGIEAPEEVKIKRDSQLTALTEKDEE